MEDLTLEQLREKVIELTTKVDTLTSEKENLTNELETSKTNHQKELDERETTIASLRQHNNDLFRKVPQIAKGKEEQKEEKEESLDDLIKDIMGGN